MDNSLDLESIRVERGDQVRSGVLAWTVPALALSGVNDQPLMDACRAIKALLGEPRRQAAMFRPGWQHRDKRCSIEWGATHRVCNDSQATRFVRFESKEVIADRLNRGVV